MPIQINEEDDGQSVVVQITGKLVDADYKCLVPELDRLIRRHGKLRLLFELTGFEGWEPGALWDEVKWDLKHFADIERVAIVGDKKWEQGMAMFYKPFTEATVRYFDLADVEEAWKWWRAEAASEERTMKRHIREKFVVGNWKMHTTAFEAEQLARGVIDGLGSADHVTVILCPPFPYLALVGDMLKGTKVALGAQNMYPEKEGAFTGEVSPTMLLDLGCKYVILGHSERRHKLGESDAFINQKVECALAAGLNAILCVGETLEQRKAKQTEAVLDSQLSQGLANVPPEFLSLLSIAYEPVWAIGDALHHENPQQAHDAHSLIRRKLSQICGESWAQKLPVQYGGSVEPENAAAFLGQHGIDGVLIGGASLKADEFLAIVHAAIAEVDCELQVH